MLAAFTRLSRRLLDRVFYTRVNDCAGIPEPVLTGFWQKALALMLKLLSEKRAGSALTFGVFG